MLTVDLVGLTSLAVGLTLLRWLGRLRAFLQGARLAQAFSAELRRRGLFPAAVFRTRSRPWLTERAKHGGSPAHTP